MGDKEKDQLYAITEFVKWFKRTYPGRFRDLQEEYIDSIK